jgi:hypothetical protein
VNRESSSGFVERRGFEVRANSAGIGARNKDQREYAEHYETSLENIRTLGKENIMKATLFTRSDQSKRHEGDLVRNLQGISLPTVISAL